MRIQNKRAKTSNFEAVKPDDVELFPYLDEIGGVEELCPDHPLNTKNFKSKMVQGDNVKCFAFYGDYMFSGYGDGLICCWNISPELAGEDYKPDAMPMLGHTNKINQILVVPEYQRVFSCSDDCTLRQWSLESVGVCEKIFKFPDPVTCCVVSQERGMLFAGSWDKMVRAILLKEGIVDRAFCAARESIRCLHIYENWLFVGGCDPVIRAYDLETGKCKNYEGHLSWVNCLTTY